ncbi:MAG TPA: serine--tRNA ligase [Bdellovibrionales bacterium]|nr:serine--tRNA ligase [Bdellovibrionales bacterium]
MIDIKILEKGGLDAYKKNLSDRGGDTAIVDQLVRLNEERRKHITAVETKKAELNKVSQEIAAAKKNKEDATSKIEAMRALGQEIKALEERSQAAQAQVDSILHGLPNKLHESVPAGKSAADNKVVRAYGEPKKFGFKAREHWELGEKNGLIDFERAGKIAGARFAILKGGLARLERALINFMLDLHTTEHGYRETIPPFIVNSNSLFGTGQLPKFKEDLFHLEGTDYFLIPTAEVPVTNYYMNETLNEEDLPIAYTAYTPCFRSEAGSYGKDTKGLIRQHQFNKVELVRFTHPDESYAQHEALTSHAEEVLKRLELPYRTAALCSGDIGFGSAKTYDIEVWLPGQNAFREISSCSNYEDFQARRGNIRFKPAGGGKPQFVHTLNGSGLAVGRTLIAIMENYQQEDGKIAVPKALHGYMSERLI